MLAIPSAARPLGAFAIATAVPGAPVATLELAAALGEWLSDGLKAQLLQLGVRQRHSFIEDLPRYLAGRAPRRLTTTSTGLAEQAAGACLDAADAGREAIGLVITATNAADRPVPCLGYELMARLAGRLRRDANVVNMQNQGCSALLKALDIARSHVAAHPRQLVLVVVTEGPTGLMRPKEPRMHYSFQELARSGGGATRPTEDMVGAFLFGDGAVALLLGRPGPGAKFAFGPMTHLSNLEPGDLELLTMNEGGILNPEYAGFPYYRLSPQVPERGAAYVRRCWDALAALEGARAPRPAFACIHTGSRKILDGVCDELGFERAGAGTASSYATLQDFGNMSSCSIGFMLADHLRRGTRGTGAMLAFGAGFSASAGSVRF